MHEDSFSFPSPPARETADEALLIADRSNAEITVLTLNRPDTRNCLSRALIESLTAEIERASHDKDVAAVVLAASGNVFSSGHDLKELSAHRADADGGRAFFAETLTACSRLMQAIVACPCPVIAAVQGTATAAGCQLVASCDLAVASENATFATPGVNIGLFCSTPMVALSRNVPRKRALEMLLLGEMVDARTAGARGLVNRVVPPAQVRDEAFSLARAIAAKSKTCVAYGKAAFYAQLEMNLAEAYEHASAIMVENMMCADAEEGIGAFLEKRPPQWKDR
jgi:enoyl-CoA hydratase/carnithine racemase